MGADEDWILARLRALRSDLIDPTIAVHHGRTSAKLTFVRKDRQPPPRSVYSSNLSLVPRDFSGAIDSSGGLRAGPDRGSG